jgi:U3 small nucleolar RNA-associated protein 18
VTVVARGGRLEKGEFDTIRVKDANVAEPTRGVVQSIAFHPNPRTPMLLTVGLDKTLRLFQVDGTRNQKLQSIHLRDFPVRRAAFGGSGREIILGARRKHFFVYNVESGKVERVRV